MGIRIGVDVGGTFTDIVLFDEIDGTFLTHKLPTSASRPSEAILSGLKEILSLKGANCDQVGYIAQGTTIALNSLLEMKGPKVGLITTKGFRDLLEIGRERKRYMYDLFQDKDPVLVPRYLRREVDERITFKGEILRPLDEAEVRKIAKFFLREGVGAVACCFLHSYANPSHELKVKEILGEEAPGLRVSVSSEVLKEYREYERFCLTAMNAFLMPIMDDYLDEFEKGVRSEISKKASLSIMHSLGGIMNFETARLKPVQSAVSGPVAGVCGAAYLCSCCGFEDFITMDMGGTSCDIGLVVGSTPQKTAQSKIGAFQLRLPMVDVTAIGAGGGSIAWVDEGGLLRVGPQSAGSEPGPACYPGGGQEPTATDANLLLGRIDPNKFLGGRILLNPDAARAAIEKRIASKLGMDPLTAASGIIRISNATMMRAIEVISVERGIDPRGLALLAFGGAGPLHAAAIAREMKIPRVIIPRHPEVLSALGTLTSDPMQELSQTFLCKTLEADLEDINQSIELMEKECAALLGSGQDSSKEGRLRYSRSVDMRYSGQAFTLNIALGRPRIEKGGLDLLNSEFVKLYTEIYTFANPERSTEIVNLRVAAALDVPKPQLKKIIDSPGGPASAARAKVETGKVYFEEAGGFVDCPFYERSALQFGQKIAGPAVITQMGSTTLILPGQMAEVDPFGNLILQTI